MTAKFIDPTESARLIRADLRREYPATRFGVRTSKYAGGASVHVEWTDGPTADAVQRIIDRYTGATFDGMIDLKEHHYSMLDGEEVLFLCDFAFTNRHYSPAFLRAAVADVSARYGMDAPAIVENGDGSAYIDQTDLRSLPGDADYFARRVMREVSRITA